jgi:hypothetical protein
MASQATLTPLIPFQPGFKKSAIAVKRQFGIMNAGEAQASWLGPHATKYRCAGK